MNKWYQEDWSEEITILAVMVIAVVSVITLEGSASNIVSAGLGGLIGYLKRSSKK